MKKVFWSISLVLALCFLTVCVLSSCSSEGAGTKELRYTYLEESDSYEVSGIRDDELKKVVIPSKYDGKPVTRIGKGAFEDCDLLVEITIPDSVTNIGAGAFSGCLDLAKIKLPDSLTHIGYTFTDTAWYKDSRNWEDGILYHGKYLIAAKEELESCSIKEGTVLIADGAFESVRLASVVIPEGVERIGKAAFWYCELLTEITLPQSVTHIGDNAFGSFSDLNRRVNINNMKAWLQIEFETDESNSLCNGGDLYVNGELVSEPVIPESVTEIKKNAFCGWDGLHKVTIHDGVSEIGARAFYNCTNLSQIQLPNGLTEISDKAFYGCSNLSELTIPNGVTKIGAYAFNGCGLNSLVLPEGVTVIGNGAFIFCQNLTQITIPKSVTRIEEDAFDACIDLTTIIYEGTVAEWNAIEKGSYLFSTIAYDARVICTDGEVEL